MQNRNQKSSAGGIYVCWRRAWHWIFDKNTIYL